MHALARHLLLGLRESLTIAGQIGEPVERVNVTLHTLHHLRAMCDGCIELVQPFASELRIVVMIQDWESLKRATGSSEPRLSAIRRYETGSRNLLMAL